jgi:hypothetical protein
MVLCRFARFFEGCSEAVYIKREKKKKKQAGGALIGNYDLRFSELIESLSDIKTSLSDRLRCSRSSSEALELRYLVSGTWSLLPYPARLIGGSASASCDKAYH